jgi:hypothetical protein
LAKINYFFEMGSHHGFGAVLAARKQAEAAEPFGGVIISFF